MPDSFNRDFARTLGHALVESDPKLHAAARATAKGLRESVPDLTSDQSEQVFSYFSVLISGLAAKGGYAGIKAETVLERLAFGFASAAFVVTENADVAE